MSSTTPEGQGIRLLMIDDDRKLCRLVSTYLTPLGFELTAVHTGTDGVERALAEDARWQAILLDVMLPGLDGFEVLKRIRAKSVVPIIMLTARGDETDRIVGLEVGADDYVPKTFSSRELLARLRAVLRRGTRVPEEQEAIHEWVIGELRINLDARQVVRADEPLVLTPLEYDLLVSLVKSRGRVKTREALLNDCRERDYGVFDRSIDVHISALRKKLGDDAREPFYIRTVRSAGYMFVGEEPA